MTPMIVSFLAQTSGTPAANPGGGTQTFLMMGLMLVMFYFLLIRPQQKQRKEMQQRLSALQIGDKVITSSGMHALVHKIGEKTVTLKIADSTMVEFDKTAVAHVYKKDA